MLIWVMIPILIESRTKVAEQVMNVRQTNHGDIPNDLLVWSEAGIVHQKRQLRRRFSAKLATYLQLN
jgi:hypothetical protein